jgi:hypothetical protein
VQGVTVKTDVDIAKQRTDAEWQGVFDRLGLKGAPIWFEWLNWTLIIGALRYIQGRTGSTTIGIVLGVSAVLFVYYFFAFFHQYSFRNIPFVRSERATRFVSIALSGLLGIGTWDLLTRVIAILSHQEGS